MDTTLDNFESSPEFKALQIRYQKALAQVMLPLLSERDQPAAAVMLAMVNALAHHLVISIRALNHSALLKPDAVERIVERMKIHLSEP
jgi:hypothetical protein